MKKPRKLRFRQRLVRVFLRAVLLLVLLTILPLLALRWIPVPASSFMLQARFAGLGDHAACRQLHYDWVSMDEINRVAGAAVIASEDQLFSQHHGFDLKAIGQVLEGGQRRGASTISQQVAKNLFLWPGRSWVRKGMEAYLTVWVELLWDKRRIIEVYLNTAQFGPCTFGVGAASEQYFAKPAELLTLNESARLAAVLPNPYRSTPVDSSAFLTDRVRWIENQVYQLNGSVYFQGW
jgi:monofunctional biosynthetic peptidoglycan transglycosylase